jgi:hypothetical protein
MLEPKKTSLLFAVSINATPAARRSLFPIYPVIEIFKLISFSLILKKIP